MTFATFPAIGRGIILLWATGLFLMLAADVVRDIEMNKKSFSYWMNGFFTLFTFALQLSLLSSHLGEGGIFDVLPMWLVLLLLFALTIGAVCQEIYIRKWRKNHISERSVKQSFDSIPTGLCYYWPEGLPKLVNTAMESICQQLTGASLLDAAGFWTQLKNGALPGCIQRGAEPIYRFSDGQVYSFHSYEMELNGHTLCELVATNVSEEYRIISELNVRRQKVDRVRKRLKELSKTITRTTAEKEVLSAKIRLHDNFGKMLLLTKRYLLEPESVDQKELLTTWRLNIRHLKNEEPEAWQVPYHAIGEQAARLGIDLKVIGELPTEKHLKPIVDTAVTVHVTNVVRHAKGTKAYLNIETIGEGKAESYQLTFTNDGKVPRAPIQEKGGLVNLRREVEAIGGTMQLHITPQFELILILPKKICNTVQSDVVRAKNMCYKEKEE